LGVENGQYIKQTFGNLGRPEGLTVTPDYEADLPPVRKDGRRNTRKIPIFPPNIEVSSPNGHTKLQFKRQESNDSKSKSSESLNYMENSLYLPDDRDTNPTNPTNPTNATLAGTQPLNSKKIPILKDKQHEEELVRIHPNQSESSL
jgi:hypothetical protein